MNLDTYLYQNHQGTRLQIFRLLRQKHVTVNGQLADSGRQNVTATDIVMVDGVKVADRAPLYFVVNKPIGMRSELSETDPRTVGHLLNTQDRQPQLHFVDELAKDVSGLTILSTDAQFLSDVRDADWPSVYQCRLNGPLSAEVQNRLSEQAVVIDQVLTTAISNHGLQLTLTLQPTTANVVQQLISWLPGPVNATRVAFGPLKMPIDLSTGVYRGLTEGEIDALNPQATEEPEEA